MFNHTIYIRLAAKVLLAFMLVLMTYGTLSPDPGTPADAAPFLHLGGMAWIALLACVSFERIRSRAWAVLFVFAYSALMELFQHYLPDRNGTFVDVGINALGCLLGVVVFSAWSAWRLKSN